ncbi:MAG: glycosyltransferase [Desulfobulbaceae bacterium DB1]|nr:MAG: glycosyltransferase [Desulfobulbaceae bacterium DB1]
MGKGVESNDLPAVSIIIPVYNEAERLPATLAALSHEKQVEILVVDGGSTDDSPGIASKLGVTVLTSDRGRAAQLNKGAEAAKGEILLFLHGDTILPAGFFKPVLHVMQGHEFVAGAFQLRIDSLRRNIHWIARLANLRSRLLKLPYGDQGLFMRATTFHELGGYADLPIMEDFSLVRRLRRKGKIVILADAVITSGRRWERLGILKTTLLNQIVIAGFLLGVSPVLLAKLYRGLQKR